jgi:phage terminase large subunit-like protein
MAIIAPTYADARDTCVEGESGLKSICQPSEISNWNRSMGELTFSTGAKVKLFSGDEPDRLRGPQHHAIWFDELAIFAYPQSCWDMAMLGLRLGDNPRVCVTTTPRPIALIRQLMSDPSTALTRGSTYANAANLAPQFVEQIIKRYEGTTLGRQELDGELIEDTPGALWQRSQIEALRVVKVPDLARTSDTGGYSTDLVRIVVAIDPSATSGGDEAGIITAGMDSNGEVYVLSDDSIQGSPQTWARNAVVAYHKHVADCLVAEDNNGGEMVSVVISTIPDAPTVKRIHASRGKYTRAEPVAALYEQAKVHHVGVFAKLEDEMTSWLPGMASPNRMDALVWAITELALNAKGGQSIVQDYLSRYTTGAT